MSANLNKVLRVPTTTGQVLVPEQVKVLIDSHPVGRASSQCYCSAAWAKMGLGHHCSSTDYPASVLPSTGCSSQARLTGIRSLGSF